jgi:hypothetical protein
VINFFNQVEPERWFVDKVKPLTTLMWFALRWDFDFAATMLNRFIHHTPALALSDFTPESEIRLSPGGLLRHLENEEDRQRLARQYADEPDFRIRLHQQILRYVEDAHVANESDNIATRTELDPDPLVLGHAVQKHQQEALHRTAGAISEREGARVVLFGHTHQPSYEPLGETGSVVINTGCWLGKRDLNNVSAETWQAIFQGTQMIDTLPVTLPYARIDYDEEQQPQAQLLDFARENDTVETGEQESSSFFSKLFSRLTTFLE